MNEAALIAILTDFGTLDPFVGIMKGVIANIAPQAAIVDLTNEIPPGDIRRAAVNLWQSRPYFPSGTIFLCVVDPGVGTSRKALLVESEANTFIGPDNGLFTFVWGENARAWELSNPQYQLSHPGSTFHGRDIFAPAAAYAARGVPGREFGPVLQDLVSLAPPRLEFLEPQILRGEIMYADRFGNLLTSLGRFPDKEFDGYVFDAWLPLATGSVDKVRYPLENSIILLQDGSTLAWANTFAEIPAGECGFVLGSSGLIEIVSNRHSAKEILNLNRGATITLRVEGDPHG